MKPKSYITLEIISAIILILSIIVVIVSQNKTDLIYNVCIIDGNQIIDEDGNVFVYENDLKSGTYYVGWDANETVTRFDDEPVTFEYLGD